MSEVVKVRQKTPALDSVEYIPEAGVASATVLIHWMIQNGGLARWMCDTTEHPCDGYPHWLEVDYGTGYKKIETRVHILHLGAGKFQTLTPEQFEATYTAEEEA